MPDQKLVSILMATYNGSKYLEPQVESILKQTHTNFELIIVDDQSTDETPKIVQKLISSDSRIRFYSNASRLGVIANFLNGLKHTQGNFIAFSDQDDVWKPHKIQTLLKLLEENTSIMLTYSDLSVHDENLNPLLPSFWKYWKTSPLQGKLDERVILRNISPGCSILFRKAVRDRMIKPFDNFPFMHDHLAFVIATSMGNIAYTNEALILYRQHRHNVIGTEKTAFTSEDFLFELNRRITCFQKFYGNELDLKIDPVIQVYEDLKKNRYQWKHWKFYEFIRPDDLKNKIQLFLQCAMPQLYQTLKTRMR